MRRIGALLGVVFLVASTSQARAAPFSISVAEPSDDAPIVTTSGLTGAGTTSAFETGTATGFAVTGALPVGTTSVLLVEPSSDPFNQPTSDLIVLQIGQPVTDGNTSQQVQLQFFSDSFQGFDRLVAAFPNAVHVTETGSLQDITAALGLPVDTNGAATILQVSASSDLNTPEIPEPASLVMFGIGVAGIFGYRWRKRPHAS